MDWRCCHHCCARRAWFQQPAPPTSCPFAHFRLSGCDALPRWRRPAPPTLSFKNPCQKPAGDVTDIMQHFFYSLWCTHKRHFEPCPSAFDSQSRFICLVWSLCTVPGFCSFNRPWLAWKRWARARFSWARVRYTCSVSANRAGARNSYYFVCATVFIRTANIFYYYYYTTLFN